VSGVTCSSGVHAASGNKDLPPQFRSGTYRPNVGSPCIDAGSNTLLTATPDTADLDSDPGTTSLPRDIVDEPRLADGDGVGVAVVDMGAYEVPAVELEPCPGDLNDDCTVNGFDLALLLGQWTGAATYPSCPPHAAADLNLDCKINGFDLASLLAGWGPCDCDSFMGGGESGGESSATSGGGPGSGCGGGIDLFQQWLDSGDMQAFWQWYACLISGGLTQ
jgi:hypothetical protein